MYKIDENTAVIAVPIDATNIQTHTHTCGHSRRTHCLSFKTELPKSHFQNKWEGALSLDLMGHWCFEKTEAIDCVHSKLAYLKLLK